MINLLSLTPLSQAVPAASTDSSASPELDFSALLTELVGPVQEQVQLSSSLAAPSGPTGPSGAPLLQNDVSAGSTLQSLLDALKKAGIAIQPEAAANPAEESLPTAATGSILRAVLESLKEAGIAIQPEPVANSANSAEEPVPAVVTDSILRALLDALKKAGISIQPEAAKPGENQSLESQKHGVIAYLALQTLLNRPANGPNPGEESMPVVDFGTNSLLEDVKKFEITSQEEAVLRAEAQPVQLLKEAVVTTDTIESIRQKQMPPRAMVIQSGSAELKAPDRKIAATAPGSGGPGAAILGSETLGFGQSVDTIEQPLAAQSVEFPELPKLQVVRTVSMEVGDAESHVIIRIEDHGGGMSLHFGTGSETMQRSLQASVGSLVRALKREKIELSNLEVSRTSPLGRVSRMKEAH